MHVWKYGARNDGNKYTHYISVNASYNKNDDCYEITVRQEPYNSSKGTKIINFVATRHDLDGLLKIAKIHGGLED